MAKIIENHVVIKLSKIAKDNDESTTIQVSNDVKLALEQVVQELVGNDVVVEVEQ